MKKEIWKDIPDYEGLYQVSNLGRVKSLERVVKRANNRILPLKERILKPAKDKRGYYHVMLCLNGKIKAYRIHKLVAIVFLNHKPKGRYIVVDHIDNNKTNNKVSNLQITTARNNASKDKKGYTSKYTGVSWHKAGKKWSSQIHHKGKKIHIGLYDSEYKAYLAYQAKLKKIV